MQSWLRTTPMDKEQEHLSIVEIAENFHLRWDVAILDHPYLDRPENMQLKLRAESIKVDMKHLHQDIKNLQ